MRDNLPPQIYAIMASIRFKNLRNPLCTHGFGKNRLDLYFSNVLRVSRPLRMGAWLREIALKYQSPIYRNILFLHPRPGAQQLSQSVEVIARSIVVLVQHHGIRAFSGDHEALYLIVSVLPLAAGFLVSLGQLSRVHLVQVGVSVCESHAVLFREVGVMWVFALMWADHDRLVIPYISVFVYFWLILIRSNASIVVIGGPLICVPLLLPSLLGFP